jgi:predicted DsbA family dithiol-disulfide isomerase
MSNPPAAFYFDFIDPLSYLFEIELGSVVGPTDERVARIGFEIRPPPTPLTDIDDPAIASRWDVGRVVADELGLSLSPPRLVPWSRKAHELHLYAASRDLGPNIRAAVFDAYFVAGHDIGRIDVLVEVGRSAGLDVTETKAVLDVDRFEADVTAARDRAASAGVGDAPVLVLGAARLEGFHNRSTLGTFLRDP